MMLLGYYVFSNQELIKKLEKISIQLSLISVVTGICYVYTYYGQNYTDNKILNSFFTNLYLWIMILSIMGIGSKFLNFKNKFTVYMTKNNFNIYILHYVVVLLLGYVTVTFLNLPFILNYIVILIGTIIVLPILIEIVKRIPIIRFMVLGIRGGSRDRSFPPRIHDERDGVQSALRAYRPVRRQSLAAPLSGGHRGGRKRGDRRTEGSGRP